LLAAKGYSGSDGLAAKAIKSVSYRWEEQRGVELIIDYQDRKGDGDAGFDKKSVKLADWWSG
jgi:hypothetical protein